MNRTYTLALTLCAVSALPGRAAAQVSTVSPSVRVNVGGFNPNGANSVDGATVVAAGDGVFHAAWVDQTGTSTATQDVYFASSLDGGRSWSAPTRVDSGDAANATDSDQVHVAVTDGGTIVVIWEEKRDAAAAGSAANEDLFYNRSIDGGATWMPAALPLNSDTAGAHVTSDIDIASISADGEALHVCWEEDTTAGLNGNEEVRYVQSADGGATWSAPVILNATPGLRDVDEPHVTAADGLVLVYWVEDFGAPDSDDLYVTRSTDGGVTFSAPVAVESSLTGNPDEPRAAIAGDLVVITYTENQVGDPAGEGVMAVVSNDGGVTWAPEVTISAQMFVVTSADADSPFVAVVGDDAYIVYDEDSRDRLAGGAGDSAGNVCYLAYSNDRGATWTVDVDVEAGRNANRPRVVANPGMVAIYKEHNPNGANVPVFAYSLDRGTTWSPFQQVPGAGPDVDEGNAVNESPYVAIDPVRRTAVAVFMDNSVTGANEVYSSRLGVAVPVGAPYCTPVANSTGVPSVLSAVGSTRVAENELTLSVQDLPVGAPGFFLASRTQDVVTNVMGSAGTLCLGGAIGRGVGGAIVVSDSLGRTSIAADLTALPQPTAFVAALAGETWSFQFWHRDLVAQVATTSNLSNGLAVTFE